MGCVAALPALAVPALAVVSVEPDPIFAAIERWKEALAVEDAAYVVRNDAQEGFRDRHGVLYPDGTLNEQTIDFEATVAPAEEAADKAADVRIDAAYAVFETVPTTLAGMRAKIDFAFDVDHTIGLLFYNGEHEQNVVPRQFMETLYEAARMMAVRS